jgi:hypothetical protein
MTVRVAAPPDKTDEPPFPAGQLPPRKVAWLHPLELVRTGYHALISRVATGFLDRREMLAAIDEGEPPGHVGSNPTLVRTPRTATRPPILHASNLQKAEPEGIWIDFVADLGDSWDATYATAMLIAKNRLKVRGLPTDADGNTEELPQASVLVLGGDLVYPRPSRNAYRTRLRSAFMAAFPKAASKRTPCALAIPGNHDWYDGLTNFVREFCQGGQLGGWQLVQNRSYFAAKVAPRWWIWGIDIALDTRIDSPQQAFFLEILDKQKPRGAEAGPPDFVKGDGIILCTAKPVWLDDPRHSKDAYRNLAYFVKRVIEPNATAPLILAGDLHHYSRYENDTRQLITSGGGGAYLTGTHHLPARVPELEEDAAPATGQAKTAPASKEEPYRATQFPYPSAAESRHLAMRALWLVCRAANWPFAIAVGAIYWVLAWPLRASLDLLFARPRQTFLLDIWNLLVREEFLRSYLVALVILIGCALYALAVNEGSKLWRAVWGVVHGKAHIVTALSVAWLTAAGNLVDRLLQWLAPDWKLPIWLAWLPDVALGVVFVLIAAVTGATLVGLYLVLSDRLFRWHRNDVFAALSIIDYRNFLRLHFRPDGSLEIYPIGLRKVPRQWRARITVERRKEEHADTQVPPHYEPGDYDLSPHLIEAPIRIPPPEIKPETAT